VHPYDAFELVLSDKRHAVLTETRGTVDAAVKRLETFRGKHKNVALAVDYHGVRGWLPRSDGTTIMLPHDVSLRVDATKSPTPKVELVFASQEQAAAAHDFLTRDLKRMVESSPQLRLLIGSLFDTVQIDLEAHIVRVQLELTADQANLLLGVAEGLVDKATPDDPTRDTRRKTLRETSPVR
jgi:hypothetical protein